VVEKRLVDLNAVVRDMERMLSRLLGETVTIRLDLAESLPNVLMDPGQVEQVLANLCVNGRDAMPRGGTLTIGTRTQVLDGPFCARHPPCQPGEHVALVVTDTGHGMTDDVRSHLFEPFFTTKERGKGTGLGLSTVFGIVFDGRGLVDVDTEVGRGTTVTVYLPVATGVQRTKTGSVGAVAGNPVRGRILVVEDDDNVRNAVVRVLQERGHSLLQARNLEEARTAASLANGLDLLVTDVVMPGGNGREVYAAVLAIQPGIRVLFMSGYTDDEALRTGIMEDDLAFINKPFSPDALAARVRELLSETR
jgi:CheY-like chemotaxis protein